MKKLLCLVIFATIFILLTGCSGSSPMEPPGIGDNGSHEISSPLNYENNRTLWGLWTVSIDPVTLQAEVVPLRTTEFTANVTRFMQPPASPINMLSIALNGGDPSSGYFIVDITVNHPFPGVNFYNGFDVVDSASERSSA